MLVNVPLEFKDVNGYNRLCGTVYHTFNNQRCKVKLISYYIPWIVVEPTLLRIDCPELCPVGIPTPLYGYNGNGIMITAHLASQYQPHRSYEGYEVDVVGDTFHFDIVPASMPADAVQPFPFPLNILPGYLMLDITPV